jgi:CHAT domain-containing protein
VDDRATRELFRRFHQGVRRGDDPASALAAAQNAMLGSGDPYLRHPGRWAGFVNIGGFRAES